MKTAINNSMIENTQDLYQFLTKEITSSNTELTRANIPTFINTDIYTIRSIIGNAQKFNTIQEQLDYVNRQIDIISLYSDIEVISDTIYDNRKITLQDLDENVSIEIRINSCYDDISYCVSCYFSNFQDEDGNNFLVMPNYADVIIDENNGTETIFEDIEPNTFAKLVKGDDVNLQINDKYVDGKTFVYDGCHKIYVIQGEEDRLLAQEYGYIKEYTEDNNGNNKEYPISEIEEYYLKSCPLRFIQYFKSLNNIVEQGSILPMFIYY